MLVISLFDRRGMNKPLADRIIGTYGQEQSGPLVIAVGGIHGNEPAGVKALERVFARLQRDQPELKGRLIGLRGNLRALGFRERYLERDLNRLWTEEHIQLTRKRQHLGRALCPEDQELLALLEVLGQGNQAPFYPKILIDLHTTSAPGGRFSVVEDDPFSLRLASALHAPVIMGLTKALIGTTASYCVDQGWHGLAFEAGQHHDPRAIDDHVAAIWTVLQALEVLPPRLQAHAEACSVHLRAEAQHLPDLVEVVYRHVIAVKDGFRMRPGYVNFQPVEAGEHLADDGQGPILAPFNGLILMPLYQPQGADGFFIVQPRDVPEPKLG